MIITTADSLLDCLKKLKPMVGKDSKVFINGLSLGVVNANETVVCSFEGQADESFTAIINFELIEKLVKNCPKATELTLNLIPGDDVVSPRLEISTSEFSYQFIIKDQLSGGEVFDVDGDNFACDVSAIADGLKDAINGLPESSNYDQQHYQKVNIRADDFLAFQASDGNKAIRHQTTVWPAFKFNKYISAAQAKGLTNTVAKLRGDVLVGIGDNHIRISQPGFMVIVKCVDPLSFPNFDTLVPPKEDGTIKVDVKVLVNTLKQNLKADISNVQLIHTPEGLVVSSESLVKGHTRALPSVKLKATVDGNPGKITVNAQLLNRVLTGITGLVTLSIRGTVIIIKTEKTTRIVAGMLIQE